MMRRLKDWWNRKTKDERRKAMRIVIFRLLVVIFLVNDEKISDLLHLLIFMLLYRLAFADD